MKPTTPRLVLLLPWLSLPLLAAVYLLLWDRIPEPVVVHFDRALRPAGRMPRGHALAFGLAVLLFVLVLTTLKLRRQAPSERQESLTLQYLAVTSTTLFFVGLLMYNIARSLF